MFSYGQNNVGFQAPKIVVELHINEKIEIDGTEIHFENVISDSRCPQGTNCVWPGEAEVLLKIRRGSEVKEVKLKLPATAASEKGTLVIETSEKAAYAYALQPYPVAGEKISAGDYFLDLYIEELQKH